MIFWKKTHFHNQSFDEKRSKFCQSFDETWIFLSPIFDLNPKGFENLNPQRLENLNPARFENLNPVRLENLNPQRFENLNPGKIWKLGILRASPGQNSEK